MINLLPPAEKKRRLEENNLKLVWILGLLFLSFLICFNLVLALVKAHILKQIETQENLIGAEKGQSLRFNDLETDVKGINETLAQFNLFYKSHFDVPAFLGTINNLLLPGIYLDNFSYQRKDSRVIFSGKAISIDRAYEFREKLKKDKKLSDIKFTIPDWSQAKEVSFQVSCTAKQ